MVSKAQVAPTQPEALMPAYMESFLAHLRLLVGVPLNCLVPDARLLPEDPTTSPSGSIRFFYVDRSWTDRLVDGAVAVGKIGTREQAHHQAHEPAVRQQLDLTERIVRRLQRAEDSFVNLRDRVDTNPADVTTGFLLRSPAVSGWPHMDVRAYDTPIPEPFDPGTPEVERHQLTTLRLERLAPGVLIALFQGIPRLVTIEEPHHGVQFGIRLHAGGFAVDRRQANGQQILDAAHNPIPVDVPVRAAHSRVIAVAELRKRLFQAQQGEPRMPVQTGSANFAVQVLQPPWRQRFEGMVDHAGEGRGSGRFVSGLNVAARVTEQETTVALTTLLAEPPHG
jgi:hypothetical protein